MLCLPWYGGYFLLGAFWRFYRARLLPIAAIHDRSAARAALVMAADEFHSGRLSTPGAAVSQRPPLPPLQL